jgi:hypothetical protein
MAPPPSTVFSSRMDCRSRLFTIIMTFTLS